jgi:NAD(P)H-nitrite reductase large subunit
MNNIVILGSSPAVVSIIEQIRAQDQTCAVTLISWDGYYPYRRDMFAPLLAKQIIPEHVFVQTKEFFARNNVAVVLDKKISRINIKRKTIFTEDNEHFDYEVLMITDTPENRYPAIKGTTKERIFGFKKLKDIEQLAQDLSLVDTVAVHSDHWSGLQAAVALTGSKKEVLVIASENNFISDHFDEEVAQWLIGRFDDIGVSVIRGNPLTEVLGDKDAKAIRLKSGKVFATDVNIFVDMDEDLRLFSGTGLQMATGIYVDQQFRTNIKSIFALDQACCPRDAAMRTGSMNTPAVLEAQAKSAVAAIYGQEVPFEWPVIAQSITWDGLNLTVAGQTPHSEAVEVRRTFDQEAGKYKALYVQDNRVIGAVLINENSQEPAIMRMIKDKVPITVAEATGEQENIAVDASNPQ